MSETVAAVHVDEEGSKAHPPIVNLQIVQWKDAPAEGLKGVEAQFFECDYADGSAADADPSKQTALGVIQFDLAPNDAPADPAKPAPPAWKISNPSLTQVYSATKKTLVPATAKNSPTNDHADLVVFLGVRQVKQTTGKGAKQTTQTVDVPRLIPLTIPHEENLHDDRDDFEIGVVITDKTGASFSFLKKGQTAGSTVRFVAPVRRMLGLALKPAGGRTKAPTGQEVDDPQYFSADGRIGRFSDPKRKPPVAPDRARWDLDRAILAALKTPTSEGVDVDGLLFKNFIPAGKTRREVIDDLLANVPIAPGSLSGMLKKTDIQKAYFFFHDIGTDGFGPFFADRYPSEPKSASESVHGFMNMDGTVATLFDLDSNKGGTVYEWTKAGKPFLNGYCIGYETVSAVDRDDKDRYEWWVSKKVKAAHADALKKAKTKQERAQIETDWKNQQPGTFACIAKGKAYPPDPADPSTLYKSKPDPAHPGKRISVPPLDAWFKWTSELLEGFAALYVLASARANHLLTIATHCEVDRNLMKSLVFWTTTSKSTLKTEWSGAGSQVLSLIDSPGNVHSDPSGCNLQVLYDKISTHLNAIGGPTQLAAGMRYGTHPSRALTVGSDGKPGWAINGDSQAHSFPHQSNPTVISGSWTTKKLGP